jgi:hypothetical protein
MLFARYAASRFSKTDCPEVAPPTRAHMNKIESTNCDKLIRELPSTLSDRLVTFTVGSTHAKPRSNRVTEAGGNT